MSILQRLRKISVNVGSTSTIFTTVKDSLVFYSGSSSGAGVDGAAVYTSNDSIYLWRVENTPDTEGNNGSGMGRENNPSGASHSKAGFYVPAGVAIRAYRTTGTLVVLELPESV